ncbi:hypothetical protein TWF481_006391 [Arthrobotrys musiformis]|uniref:WSC domain-containing protein n=1 Tax=Arthrobotrys musiformis TaxID=47236 RepID=A0AAV9WGL7_9PEZI
MRLSSFLPFLPLALASPLHNNVNIVPRQATTTHVCNADLVLRALRATANLAEALSFCGAYISVTSTTTISLPTSITTTESAVTTVFYKRDDGTYSSYEDSYEEMLRRRAEGGEVEYPKWLEKTFAPSRVTSACLCLTLPAVSTTVFVTEFVTATAVRTESVKTSSSTTTASEEESTTASSSSTTSEEPEETTSSTTSESTTTSEEPEETTTSSSTTTTSEEESTTTSTTTSEEESTTTTTTTSSEEEEATTTTSSEEESTTTTSEEPEATGGSEEPEATPEDEQVDPTTTEEPGPTTTESEPTGTEEPEADPTTTEEPESDPTTTEEAGTTTTEEPESEPTATEESEPTTTDEPESEPTTSDEPETTTTEEPEPTTTEEPETTTSEGPEPTTTEDPTTDGPSPNGDPTTTTSSPTGTPTVSLGCYIDGISGKALRYQFADDALTPSLCATICSSRGYSYYGVEYSRECYCDNSINTASFQVLSEECDMTCAGDSSIKCGGRDRINIYTFDTSIEGREEPDVGNDDIQYSSLGCYQEPTSGKALTKVFSTGSMTHELCLYYCWRMAATYAGLEYGRECWCGSVLNPDATPASAGSCNVPCAGDSTKTCGAGGYLELYSSGLPVATTTSSSTTSSTPTSTVTTIGTASFTTPTGLCNPVEWSPSTGYNFHFTSDNALSEWISSGVTTDVTTYIVNGDINPSALQILFSGPATVVLERIFPVTPGITYSITWNVLSSVDVDIIAVADGSVSEVIPSSGEFVRKAVEITPSVDSIGISVSITGVDGAEVVLDSVDIRPLSAATTEPLVLGEEVKLVNFRVGGDVSDGVEYVGDIVEVITPSGAGVLGYVDGIDGSARDVELGPVPFTASTVTYGITVTLSQFPGGGEQWVLQTKVKSSKTVGCFVGVYYGGQVFSRTALSGCSGQWDEVRSLPFVIGEGGEWGG